MVSANQTAGLRVGLAGAGAALLVVLCAVAADAHVTVHSRDAKPGGTNATLVFKVPNEEDSAKTVKVEIDLPTGTPLTGVVPQAPSGWSATATADKIVFSGGSISGDDSVEFPVKVAQLPNSNTVVFKALQTYSNGDVVKWIDQAAEGSAEPAHPAPTLDLLNPSKLSADEIADAKEDAAKAAKKSAADTTAKPAAVSSATATPKATAKAAAAATAKPTASATAKPTAAATDSAPKPKPMTVHAGTGGQAGESHGSSTAPIALIVLGLGGAMFAARRLVSRR